MKSAARPAGGSRSGIGVPPTGRRRPCVRARFRRAPWRGRRRRSRRRRAARRPAPAPAAIRHSEELVHERGLDAALAGCPLRLARRGRRRARAARGRRRAASERRPAAAAICSAATCSASRRPDHLEENAAIDLRPIAHSICRGGRRGSAR
jgi:hypothetical protein